MPTSRLEVARDPALAVVVRIFVGGVAQRGGVPEQVRDDLRLAASELFAGAVEAGGGTAVAFTLSTDDSRVSLRAEGMEPAAGTDGWGDRSGLIRAMFPDADIGDTVTIRVPPEG